MYYLISGGLGFIGSNFVEYCLKKKIKVINVDNLDYSASKIRLKEFRKNKNHKFYKCSIGNQKKISSLLKLYKPNVILNFAAETHVDNSINRPIDFVKNNIFEFSKFIEEFRFYYNRSKFKKKLRFINVSTDEVYGSLRKLEKKFIEKNKFYPNNPYSASKGAGDLLARAWFKTFDLPIITTNCSNNFGPFQNKEKLIPKTIINALSKKKIPIYGKGENIRDWIYSMDHCKILNLIIRKGKIGEVYNIGGNNEIKNIELIKKICKILDKLIPLENKKTYLNLIKFVKDRPAHDLRYGINSSKIKKKLGVRIKKKFDYNLKKTIIWYIKNYKKVK